MKKPYILIGILFLSSFIAVFAYSYTQHLNEIFNENNIPSNERVVIDHFDFMPNGWPPEFQIKSGSSISLPGRLIVYNESTFIIYIVEDNEKYLTGINASWYKIPPEKAGRLKLEPPPIPRWLNVKIGLGRPVEWAVKGKAVELRNANIIYLKPGKYDFNIDIGVRENAKTGHYRFVLVIASPSPIKGGGWFVELYRIPIIVS